MDTIAFMRHLGLFLLFISTLFGSDEIRFEPRGDIQFRFDDRDKEYTTLGNLVYNKEDISYFDYTIGGHIGADAIYDSYLLGSRIYGVARLHDKDEDILKNEKSYYNNDLDNFTYLGELYLKKEFSNQSITVGRQTYKSSIVGKNFRLTNNSYEGISYRYENDSINFQSLYFNKIASSTLANTIPFNHKYGFLGYGYGYDTSGFAHISTHIINKDLQTDGAIDFEFIYKDEMFDGKIENLYVDNFFNTTLLTLGYRYDMVTFSGGYIYQTSVGKDYLETYIQNKQLKSEHYQGKIEYKKDRFKVSYFASYTPKKEDSIYYGTLFSPFSTTASWLTGLNSAHAILADTFSQKILLSNGTKLYKVPLGYAMGYVKYNIGEKNGLRADSVDTTELYLHLKGYFSKNLSAMIQHSRMNNYDPLTKVSINTKLALEYKF